MQKSTQKIAGVPLPLLAVGALGAGLVAYLSSGSGDTSTVSPGTPQAPAADPNAGGLPKTTKPTTGNSGTPSTSTGTTLKTRKPLVKAASPLLYVFVDSLGGEGIFDRLRNKAGMIDGNGLDRIVTLANHELAGFATGAKWVAPDTRKEYTQLYMEIDGQGYNYWIQKEETKQVHGPSATAAFGWNDNFRPTETTKASIIDFYARNYKA